MAEPSEVAAALTAAARWRAGQRRERAGRGVVLVWAGECTGWKDRLRDVQDDRPGVLAVDVAGRVWEATGGNYWRGAEEWREITGRDQWPA